MKYSFSLGTTSCATNLALWYWNELSEMIGVCGYDGIEIPFQAWSFNGGRGAAPVCAAAISVELEIELRKQLKCIAMKQIEIVGRRIVIRFQHFFNSSKKDLMLVRLYTLGIA